MHNVFFKPWIGENFENGGIFKKKILALGEAHICGSEVCESCGIKYAPNCEDLSTVGVVNNYLENHSGNWSRTFRKFERALFGDYTDNTESEAIWNSIAFYNYIQTSLDASRKAPTYSMFAEGEEPFWEVLKSLRPDLIIVWGKTRMYDNLSSKNWEADKPIQFESKEALTGWYTLEGKRIRAIWIAHPSSAFSWKKWHKIVNQEIN